MSHAEQLEWEARTGRLAGVAAVLVVVCIVGAGLYLRLSLSEQTEGDAEALILIDRHASEFILSGIIQSLGLLLLIPVLLYLYRVTLRRRPQLPKPALGLAIFGPFVTAALVLTRQGELLSLASDFTSGMPTSGAGGEARAEDLIRDRRSPLIAGLGFAGNLALGLAVALLALNAMRAGLMSRFLGIIGIIVGVLYLLPVGGAPQFVQLFWLGALAALFLGRWPGGRGPAWSTGEAIPWPSPSKEQRASEYIGIRSKEESPDPPAAQQRSSRKRKRKKRKR